MITQGGGVIGSLAAVAGGKPVVKIYDHAGAEVTTSWVVPEFESADVAVNASDSTTMNYEGNIVAVHFTGEYFECSFRLKPFALFDTNAATTLASTLKSATLLRPGYTAYITGMPVIAAAPFTDIFNCSSVTVSAGTIQTYRWVIFGNGVSLSNAGAAGKSVTMRRYPNIPGGVSIAS